jgi:predicted dehydrogenase
VVGFGEIAKQHIKAFRALGANVVASANRSPEGRRLAELGGISRTYRDALKMVESERPDGVLISASALSQFEVIRQLIPCGVPLLIEKPPAVSFADWSTLRAQIEAQELPVLVGLNRRYFSVYHRALQRMGGIKAITSVNVEWSEDPDKILGLGHPPEVLPLLNFTNSIHGLDLLVFFAGAFSSVDLWGRNLDQTGQRLRWQMGAQGITDRGVRAAFQSSWDVPGRWRLVVDAPDVRMVSAPLETAVLYGRGRDSESVEASDGDQNYKPGFYDQASSFLEMIQGRKPPAWPAASLEEISAGMLLAEMLTQACLKSEAFHDSR